MRQRQQLSPQMVIWLQTTAGNRAVQRLLAKNKSQAATGRSNKRSAKFEFKLSWRHFWALIVHFLSWMAVWKR
jgi:hypothetical protein